MRILFYDTESSGMPLWSEPSSDPRQPHILQIAAALVDSETRKIEAEMNLLVRPQGWEIDPEALAVHGITHDHATRFGISEGCAIAHLLDLWGVADKRVGHVENFDARMARIAIKRYGYFNASADVLADSWKSAPAECTSQMTEYLNPALGRGHGRGPKLTEAYRYFFGRELEDAHTASADMRACMAVYFAVLDDPSSQPRPAAIPSETHHE